MTAERRIDRDLRQRIEFVSELYQRLVLNLDARAEQVPAFLQREPTAFRRSCCSTHAVSANLACSVNASPSARAILRNFWCRLRGKAMTVTLIAFRLGV